MVNNNATILVVFVKNRGSTLQQQPSIDYYDGPHCRQNPHHSPVSPLQYRQLVSIIVLFLTFTAITAITITTLIIIIITIVIISISISIAMITIDYHHQLATK